MKEKKPVGPHKLLKICRRLFFSGALTMLAAAYLIGRFYTGGETMCRYSFGSRQVLES